MSQGQYFTDMAACLYHAHPSWSHSQLKLIPDSPELFYGYHIAKKWTFEQTADMWIGECVHAVALENKKIITPPAEVLSSNGQRRGKAWEAWKAEHECEYILREQEADECYAMVSGLYDNEKSAALLRAEGFAEVSCFWTDDMTGLNLRGRLDKLCRFGNEYVIADLKCTSIDPGNERIVAAHVLSMAYHRQAAFYCDAVRECFGKEPAGFLFMFVKNSPPYNSVVWRLDQNSLDLARRRNRAALLELNERLERDAFTGQRHNRENLLFLPKYAFTDDPGDNLPTPLNEFAEFA
jgi:hypothetical protein